MGAAQQALSSYKAPASDPNWSSVVLLAVNDNKADATTAFADQSTSAKTLTAVGHAQYDTAVAPPANLTSWALFDGVGDRVTSPDSADWHFGSGDFTLEGWFRTTSIGASPVLWHQWDPGSKSWIFEVVSGNLNFYYSTDGANQPNVVCGAVANNTTYFFAVSRIGNTLDAYINSTRGSTTDFTGVTLFNATVAMEFGGYTPAPSVDLPGHIGALRLTKGVGRYSGASITVPTPPFPTS